ncbi:MAG: N-acetyl-gamma-glutamyl-phosphate reductase [Desulfobacterales bacterium]|nr:N-acetyl-gamma-glutamyl-phosphate reductase [Desulfobacterales bacterium]
MKIRVGIVGGTGYTGAELVRILSRHPNVSVDVITARQFANSRFSDIFPSMVTIFDSKCESFELDSFCQRVDIAFVALPHKVSMEFVPNIIRNGLKVIDLSADFRFRDVTRYESVYHPHSAPELIQQSVYGLSEIYREQIKSSMLIGNPGCYPTSVLLPLIPLLKEKQIHSAGIIVDSKSGVSGAGRSPSLKTLFGEVNDNFKAYQVTGHRHRPEMEEQLSIAHGNPVRITFVPHLLPVNRGILTTIYASAQEGTTYDSLKKCMAKYYSGCPFVRVLPQQHLPALSYVRGTNLCDIWFTLEPELNRVIIISAIDNLVKGAAGQAVQNMNIMMGLSETTGLETTPSCV